MTLISTMIHHAEVFCKGFVGDFCGNFLGLWWLRLVFCCVELDYIGPEFVVIFTALDIWGKFGIMSLFPAPVVEFGRHATLRW